MPSVLNVPGVYIEEIPSDVHPIAGISTSDTAFIDYFPRGPLNTAVRVASFAEFARAFGGLNSDSDASYAIAQFFANGGAVAWVVRIAGGTPKASTKMFQSGGTDVLAVSASSEGTWGDSLQVSIDSNTVPTTERFNLTVTEYSAGSPAQPIRSETFRNLSMDATNPLYVEHVINGTSQLITVAVQGAATATTLPDNGSNTPLASGADGTVPSTLAPFQAGIDALDQIAPAHASLMCLPGSPRLSDALFVQAVAYATNYCELRRIFLLVDIPSGLTTKDQMSTWRNDASKMPATSPNSAIYFPRLNVPDPFTGGQPRSIPASGTVAGITARTDAARGVWKAPAGTEATIRGASLVTELNDDSNGQLNILGVNVLRSFPIYGSIVWGARTTDGADAKASPWKYIPVRRMALYLEESLYQGLKWVTFEPNDDPLWSQIRLNVGAFLNGLFRQGAFAGVTTREAYFVRCDKDTTTPADQDRGVVNVVIGFAPLKPAEFVVLQIQQIAGQSAG